MNLKQALISHLGFLDTLSLLFKKANPARPVLFTIPNSFLPDRLVNQWLPAYQILQRAACVQPGERLLVHDAASPAGQALLELACLDGLKCYGTASAAKHELLEELGTVGIDSRREDFLSAIRTLCGDGVDVVVHPLDLPRLTRSFRALRRGGRLVVWFSPLAHPPFLRRLEAWLEIALLKLLPNGKQVILYRPVAWQRMHPAWFRKDLSLLADWMEEGKLI